jgi:hypothetical protein
MHLTDSGPFETMHKHSRMGGTIENPVRTHVALHALYAVAERTKSHAPRNQGKKIRPGYMHMARSLCVQKTWPLPPRAVVLADKNQSRQMNQAISSSCSSSSSFSIAPFAMVM